ncbi:unnamed protein product [Acanthoscelides obtectus]|uniref:Uncharacterized protein n=1 Tax=Acanthoscelides obtectus TaxID=200917 RepID=A0A9P0MBX8_ACAOB|nr:unnamed protein product [Acanthoscelides obtectus]CAK1629484.1 hypothetical protein AOBTE_LOCUS5770 [Acanthoscelides obtectus]
MLKKLLILIQMGSSLANQWGIETEQCSKVSGLFAKRRSRMFKKEPVILNELRSTRVN